MKRKWLWIFLVLAVAFGFYLKRKLTVYREKLGELSFYNDGNIELKIVHIFENLPLHYVGPHFSVACKSAKTAGKPERKQELIEAGWNIMPSSTLLIQEGGPAVTLEILAERAKKIYYVQDGALVIPGRTGIYFSLDDCNSYSNFELLRNLPKEIPVSSTPEFEKCEKEHAEYAAKGIPLAGDCQYYKFVGNGVPIFEEIKVEKPRIYFRVRSNSLNTSLEVESKDSGYSWTVK